MRIVVLDGYTLNPGDLTWDGLLALGDCEIHDRTAPELVVSRSAEAEAILTNKVVLDAAVFAQLPGLRYVGVLATGTNVVDLEAARQRNITVTNVPAYSTHSVAQLVLALLLELAFQTGHHSRRVHEGAWSRCPDFSFRDAPLIELAGKTMGIVGFGRIGAAVTDLAAALGMRVIVSTRTRPRATASPVEFVALDPLFAQSDVVSLHCPLTPQTQGMVNEARLRQMKPSAYLINTARGPLVDEVALAAALRAGEIAGAGLDVLSVEPPPADHPLLRAPNCVITPHLAWGTREARQRLMHEAVENLAWFLMQRRRNVVA